MTSAPAPAVPATSARLGREATLVLAVAAVWAVFAAVAPGFLGARNLSMLAIELSITAALALGMLLVIVAGHVDLAAGSGVGLCGGAAAVLVFGHGWPAPLALAVTTVGAAVLWRLVGLVIVRERVPAFIITLGGLLVWKGLHWLVIGNATIPVAAGGEHNLYAALTTVYLPGWLGWALGVAGLAALARMQLVTRRRRQAHGLPVVDGEVAFLRFFVVVQIVGIALLAFHQYRGVPLSLVILVAVATAIRLLLGATAMGRHLVAVGGNEDAARLAGVPVERTVVGAFSIMGVIVALTGFLQTAYAGASTTTVGSLMELDAVAACVMGGASLRGGRGTVGGVLAGALIMTSLMNGMTLMALSPETKLIVRGLVLAVAVWLDVRMTRARS